MNGMSAGRGAPVIGFVVAIDGPAGAGKSTVAKRVAEECGLSLVDTGAIYRTLAWTADQEGISHDDEDTLAARAMELQIRFRMVAGENRTSLERGRGEEDVSAHIRTPEMSLGASAVSRHPKVRAALLELQRRLGAHNAVLEGRDIGTVVFPNAPLKIFLTASAQERARRRAEELAFRGVAEPYDKVLAEILQRDRQDSERAVAPLKPAEDSWYLDSTDLTAEEVVEQVCGRIATERRLPIDWHPG